MKLRHLLAALLVVACAGDGEVAETPPVVPATTTSVEATTSTSLPGATVDEVLQATAELETYRFTWKTTIDELDGESVQTNVVGLIGGAVDHAADAMVWRIEFRGLAPETDVTYTVVRSEDSYFIEGLPDNDGSELQSGFAEVTDLSAFPKPFLEPQLEPARLPEFYFSWSADAEIDGDVITGTIDPSALDAQQQADLAEILEIGDVPLIDMGARIADGTIAELTMVYDQPDFDLRTTIEISIAPAQTVELPDVTASTNEADAWMDEFLEAFMAGDDERATDTLEQMSDVIDEQLRVPDVTGLEPADAFCTIYGNLPYRWSTDALFPAQLWLDHARAARAFAPNEIGIDFELLLGHWEDRMAWQFTGGERPPFTDAMEAAERRVSRWAVDSCDLPQIPGPTPNYDGYYEFTCDYERRSIAEAQDAYYAEFGTYASHLHLLETHTDVFFGADHLIIDAANDAGYEIIVIEGGACDGP